MDYGCSELGILKGLFLRTMGSPNMDSFKDFAKGQLVLRTWILELIIVKDY